MATAVPTCRDHLICQDQFHDPCYQSRVMKGKLLEKLATQSPCCCEYKIMRGGSFEVRQYLSRYQYEIEAERSMQRSKRLLESA